ncbi:MAG: hypothetical protein M1828_007227 [Chrysothrix sp. TS-e1954]|nr:MAG: hypothetical protein M1828_007227 [Chrysothrix sp. TS-e1954]
MESSSLHFGLASQDLLDKIDQLFACNVGEYVDLPQLVVVGDQSSGKSSVLAALTKLSFPRESNLCTRFATQITFRRTQETHVTASVIPAQDASEEHALKVRSWTKNGLQSLDVKSFADIMRQASDVMGLTSGEIRSDQTFSNDVLRLEIGGPKEAHLSVIDVPGIFKRTTSGLTTKLDMEMVQQMVHDYMKNHRSVMLAVVPANVDIATQEILEKAEELDPDGIRTLAVLTKPDLTDKGAEINVIHLVEGKRHPLKLGWHILRNAGQAELEKHEADRDSVERKFFANKSPWSGLDKDRVGIDSFRNRLQEVLTDHIRREFPKVKSEIAKKVTACQQHLEALGERRQTSTEQSRYLMGISMQFQELVAEALSASHSCADVFDENPSLRLATATVNRGDLMSNDMATNGHTFHFQSSDLEPVSDRIKGSDSSSANFEQEDAILPEDDLSDDQSERISGVRQVKCHPDLEDLLHVAATLPEPQREGIYTWLEAVYRNARGFELGTLNPWLLAVAMKQQSKKWKDLALGYIADLITLAHTFVVDLLRVVCPVKRVRQGVMSLLMDHLMRKYRSAIAQANFLLEVELSGTPATLNHYFNDNLQKCRQKRNCARMESRAFTNHDGIKVVRFEDTMQSYSMSNADHDIQDLHDILHSYYKVACKRFVDCLRMHVADHYLITGSRTPLKLFSPGFVAAMTPEQLEEVAGEDLITKRKRAQLEKELKDLEQGKRILK